MMGRWDAMDRLMGFRPESTRDRHVRERREHQFSNDIGGSSANYREPKFGTVPTPVAKEDKED